jgi:membrane protein
MKMRQFQHWTRIFRIASKRFFYDQYTYRAAALTFTTLLSIVPLLSVIVFIVAKFPFFDKVNTVAENYILTNFIPTSGTIIRDNLNNFTMQASRLPMMGIFFLFVTAFALIMTIEHTFNDIWGVRWETRKMLSLIIYWVVIVLAPLLIGVSIFVSTYLFSLSWISDLNYFAFVKKPVLSCLPLLLNTFIFSLLYIVVPNFRVQVRDGIFGGFAAAVMFELAKLGFAFYIKQFPSYELIYGALGTIPVFFIWIYISWLIILFGALLTHTKYKSRQH